MGPRGLRSETTSHPLPSSSARQVATYPVITVVEEAAVAVSAIYWLVVVYISQWAMSRNGALGQLGIGNCGVALLAIELTGRTFTYI